MGKEQRSDNGLKTFVFNVDMHCKCNGCIKKINDGMKRISLSEGVEWADLMVDKAEVKVVGTMDLLREVTKKHVTIRTQSTVSEGGTAASQETKDLVGQSSSVVTPSAPPLAETWNQTVPSERCAYRWSAPSCTLGMWTASDITGHIWFDTKTYPTNFFNFE